MKAPFFRAAALSLLIGCSAFGASVGGLALPVDRDGLALHGAGLLRKGLFFKIYVGALYLEDKAHANRVLEAVPKRIDIHYFHHTPRHLMIREANATLEKHLTEEQRARLTPKIDTFHQAFRNGKRGSVASIIYRPGEGLTYAFDEKPVITIDCDDLARAYFSVWLGEQPSSRSVKRAMLEGWRS